jgi:deoxyadenosine/deoxycytidine kinase
MTVSLPQGSHGPLISIEGISGVGKTYLTHRLVRDQAITAIEEMTRA